MSSTRRRGGTPYSTAARYSHPDTRSKALKVLMNVQNDPALALQLSAVNKNTRSVSRFPTPPCVAAYYRHYDHDAVGRYYNRYFETKAKPGKRPETLTTLNKKASETFRDAKRALVQQARPGTSKSGRAYLVNHKDKPRADWPAVFRDVLNAIVKHEARVQNNFPAAKSRTRYTALVYPPAPRNTRRRRGRAPAPTGDA